MYHAATPRDTRDAPTLDATHLTWGLILPLRPRGRGRVLLGVLAFIRGFVLSQFEQKGAQPLDSVIRVRVTAADRAHICRQAEAACLTVSEYIRRCATERVILSRTDDVMIRELRRIGGLLKHIHVESAGAYSESTAAGLESIRAAIDSIARTSSGSSGSRPGRGGRGVSL